MIEWQMNFLMPHLKDLHLSVFFLFSFLFLPFPIAADQVNYFYDDAGRLVKVEKGAERVLYQYDEVGNLLSIIRENSPSQALPPILQSVDPDILIIGNSYQMIISGQNLHTTSSVTSDNPNVTIKYIAAIDTKILAAISIGSGASPGQANITVTTSYGSASMPVNLYSPSITPAEVTLFPAGTTTLSVSLTPPAPRDVNIKIANKNPDIVEAPPSITISSGGSAGFIIKARDAGTGTIGVGSAETTVLVVGGNSMINAAPVSVALGSVPANTAIQASPVSVLIGNSFTGSVISYANPVGVVWPVILDRAVSGPVSVVWPTVPNAVTVSGQVCVQIQQ
jgi:YD repeat-containing protein